VEKKETFNKLLHDYKKLKTVTSPSDKKVVSLLERILAFNTTLSKKRKQKKPAE
jgi:hypothetical protein